MSSPVVIFAYCIVSFLMLYLVVRPMIRVRTSSRRPNLKEWQSLDGAIRTMSKSDLNNMPLSEPTRMALNMVLGDRSGQSNRSNLPFALQVLDDAGANAAATVRAASTLAVFSGLAGTAIAFAGALRDPNLLKGGVPPELSVVYIINCAAVLLAIFAFAYSRHIEDGVHTVIHRATVVLSQLPDRDDSDVDPLLLSTLREMTSQMQEAFQDHMGHWQEQQLGDIRVITGEIKGLADSIREGLSTSRQRAETDTIRLLEANRETLTAVEASAVRLDDALGRIVTDGVPALARLAESADSLRVASSRFENSGALDAMAAVSACVEDLRRLVDAWPRNLEGALAAAQSRIETAAVDGVKNAGATMNASVDASASRVEGIVRDSVASLPAAVSDALATSLARWQEQSLAAAGSLVLAAESLREGAKSHGHAAAMLDDTLRKLDALIEKIAGRRWPF